MSAEKVYYALVNKEMVRLHGIITSTESISRDGFSYTQKLERLDEPTREWARKQLAAFHEAMMIRGVMPETPDAEHVD